ncbi:class I SAM-dependent methyltransferase [Micromonospora sp. RTP1Z1]|uniref:class I SAM-dependent methyltransferase n=1 Tax=Micromonospora sp. RTP1Z1 TaxID=2994043 RepID=UPI0029C64302|nr:class I SAM-dependent methyltransferase [Micromonospora sp. RTP1Z1]
MRHAREHMLGLTTRPARYQRLTRRPFRGVHTRLLADIVAANLPPGSRILDVGTGPGTIPIELATAAPQVTIDGIDLSAQMIGHATAAARAAGCDNRVTFIAANASDMPFPDSSFDLIVSSMSQHHWSDVPAVVREIHRVLRPAGRAWIYDARLMLHRAEHAARREFPAAAVRRIPVRTGRLPLHLFARLAIDQAPA